jgi:hypothetical protein
MLSLRILIVPGLEITLAGQGKGDGEAGECTTNGQGRWKNMINNDAARNYKM